jgi:nitrate/TMAO reductase-like tetraheme cytochrome c subunit
MTPKFIGRAKRRCPLCHEKVTHLDEHHWQYKPEVTVFLCRACHDYIHSSLRDPTNQRAASQADGLAAGVQWQDVAYQRTVRRYEDVHGIIQDWQSFWERLNIPDREWRVAEI